MKAQVESSGSHSHHGHGNVLGLRNQDGKVHKIRHHKEEENEEIKAYLTKLQELVPFMPKNRKLSKLEVITYVIDYIRDLRQTLGLPPQSNRLSIPTSPLDMDPMEMMSQAMSHPNLSLSVINNNTNSNSSTSSSSNSNSSSHHLHHRQPLGVISTPNNSSLNGSCASQEIPQLMDKSTSADVDTRPVSC